MATPDDDPAPEWLMRDRTVPMKRCPAPHHIGDRWVPTTPEGWYLASGRPDGLDGWCRACRIADVHRRRGLL